MQPLPQPQQCE